MTGRKICFISGGIALIYGIVILALLGAGAIFNWFFFCFGILLILIGVCFRKIRGWNRWVKRALCVLLVLWLADFIWFEARAITTACRSTGAQPGGRDWIIVLGAGIDGKGDPKREFSVRLNLAEKLSTEENGLILTGGQGGDEVISEAESARNYLERRGKLRARTVLPETGSTNTQENLKNALKIIKENGGSEEDRVLIVSSGFHLFRASKLAEKIGYKNIECAGATGLRILLPNSYMQEYVSYIAARLRGFV